MALSYSEALRLLDLLPRASCADAEMAYRDLLKVWHPDRFPADERLRTKAEERTKLLNEAIVVIRKGPAETSQPATQPAPHTPQARPSSAPQSTAPSPPATPIHAYQRLSIAIIHLGVAATLLYVGYQLLFSPKQSWFSNAFGTLLLFYAIHDLIRSIALSLFRLPALSVHSTGISILGVGSFRWHDLHEVESRIHREKSILALQLSTQCLRSRSLLLRVLLFIRRTILKAHYVVPFEHLSLHPNAVVSLASYFFAPAVSEQTPKTARRDLLLKIARLMATTSVLCAAIWQFLGHRLQPIEIIPYFVIFGLCQVLTLFLLHIEERSYFRAITPRRGQSKS